MGLRMRRPLALLVTIATLAGLCSAAVAGDDLLDDALARAAQAAGSIADPVARSEALITLARAEARAGKRLAALKGLLDVRERLEPLEPGVEYVSPHPLARVARAQAEAEAGDRAAARETHRRAIRLLLDHDRYAELDAYLRDTLVQRREQGDGDGAREDLGLVLDFLAAPEARKFMKKGDVIAPRRGTVAFEAMALRGMAKPTTIAQFRARAGDFAGALRTIDDPKSFEDVGDRVDEFRAQDLREIIRLVPVRSEDRKAFEPFVRRMAEVARSNKSRFMKQYNLQALAIGHARLGEIEEALRAAAEIGLDDKGVFEPVTPGTLGNKADTFESIADLCAASGDAEGVSRSARGLARAYREGGKGPNPFQSGDPRIVYMARDLIRVGRPEEALRLWGLIHDGLEPPPDILIEAAVAESDAGNRERSRAILERARERAGAIGDRAAVAEAHARLGAIQEARRVVDAIGGEAARNAALRRIALAAAWYGDPRSALELADRLTGPEARAETFTAIAFQLARQRAAGRRPSP